MLFEIQKYRFPDASLLTMRDERLLTVIRDRVAAAKAFVALDGLMPDDEGEIAKDILEQARDILLDRKYAFTSSDRARLDFLDWPTQEASADAPLVQPTAPWLDYGHALQRAVRDTVCARTGAADLPGVFLSFGCAAHAKGVPAAMSRTEVQMLERRLTVSSRGKVLVIFSNWNHGEDLDDEIAPLWRMEVEVVRSAALWAELREWVTVRRKIRDFFQIEDKRPEGPIPELCCVVTNLFEERC